MLNIRKNRNDLKSQTTLIILFTALSQLTTQFLSNMVTVALPTISLDLGLTVAMINWISIIFLISFISVSIPLAKVLSKYGVKKCTIIGYIVLVLSLFLSACANSLELFMFSRVLQGICSALLNIALYMIVMLAIPQDETGKVLGIVASTGYIGLTIAPSITGFITYYLSWRYVFLLLIPLFLINLVLIHNIHSEWKEEIHIDKIGSIIFTSFVILSVYGLSHIINGGLFFLLVSIVLLGLFILYEKNQKNPIYDIGLLRNVHYVIGNIAAFTSYFITFTATYVLSLYLQVGLNYNAKWVGLILLITPTIMIFISFISGKLSDKHDSHLLSSIALILIGFAIIILVFMDNVPFYLILLALIIQGIGHGMFSSPNNKFVLTLVNVEDLPDASSMLATMKEFGKIVGLSIFNIYCYIYIGNNNITNNILELDTAINHTLNIAVVLTMSTIILLLLSKLYFKENHSEEVIQVFKSLVPKNFKNKFKKKIDMKERE